MKPKLTEQEEDKLTVKILTALRVGRKEAITAGQFAARFGLKDDRKVRLAINELIDQGWPVLSSVDGPYYGYFFAETQEELDKCIGQLESRAIETWDRANKIKKAAQLAGKKFVQLSLGV